MRHLVTGAGASIAQAINSGVATEKWPPTMNNFAKKTWEKSPAPFLSLFLRSKSIDAPEDEDPREIFYALEAQGTTNIEEFMEFSWRIKDTLPECQPGWSWWNNLMRHSVGDPIALLINQAFWGNGVECVDLDLTKQVLSKFSSEDLVLNLNYDTLIEIALMQAGTLFAYLPNRAGPEFLPVCKPHGSLNMAFTDESFAFGQPDNLWPLFTTGDNRRAFTGLIPPRSNKSYKQMPMAKIILDGVSERRPSSIVFWGIGLTGSDVDLNEIYKSWSERVDFIDVINPDLSVGEQIEFITGVSTRRYEAAEDWLSVQP